MRRLISIDYLRGLSIFLVVAIHSITFNYDAWSAETDPSLTGQMILYFSSWAGFFAIISGVANSTSIYGLYRKNKISDIKMLNYFVSSGITTLILHYLYLAVFSPGFLSQEQFSVVPGILPYFLRTGQFRMPSITSLLFADALLMIGWSTIVTGVILFTLTKINKKHKPIINYFAIFVCATCILLIYPILDTLAAPIKKEPITMANLWYRVILSWIIGDMDPIFPYAGFSLYGVLVGMLLVDGVKPKTVLTYLYGTGTLYFVIGLILTNGAGFINRNFQTPLFPSLILMLGPMLIFLGFWMQIMDFQSDEVKKFWLKHTKTIRTFGLLSLTLFMFEGAFAAIMRIPFNLISPGWSLKIEYLLLLMLLVIIFWIIILQIWSRNHYKGSLEWLLIVIMAKITGKTSTRTNFDGFLNNPDVYLEKHTEKKQTEIENKTEKK